MPIRTVAQAAADIRLSGDKANADFERIRRDLIAKAQRLEADLAVAIPVTVDQESLQNAAAEIAATFDDFPPVDLPTTLDSNQVLEDLATIQQIANELEIELPLRANLEAAEGDISALEHTEAVVQLPVELEAEEAIRGIEELRDIESEIEVPVRPNTERFLRDLQNIPTLRGGGFVLPLRADTRQVQTDLAGIGPVSLPVTPAIDRSEVDALDPVPLPVIPQVDRTEVDNLPPVPLQVVADTDQAVADITAIGTDADPVLLPVIAETDEAIADVNAVGADVEPVHVPVTFEDVGPGISQSRLARLRAELDEVSRLSVVTGISVPIEGDTDPVLADIAALSGVAEPVAVPVVSDTDNFTVPGPETDFPPVAVPVVTDLTDFNIPGGPDDPPPPPIDVRIVADLTQFDIPGGPGDRPPDPITVPILADTQSAEAQVTAFGTSIGREIEPEAAEAGRRSGVAFGREFSTAVNRAMTLVAVTVGGLLATSLVEGFQRFTVIEDSTASLTVALQDASAAGQVLADVLNVVRGTPFRLDDFARAATNMISFGVAAEQVPRFLTAIGEAAATRGSQANQFAQSLATIFGQIQAIGRINGEDVWQFGNVGVDVLRILGNTIGKTTEEIRKMISEGAIPAGFALEAIASGILNGTTGINGATVAFSGVMEKLGDTLSGSIENFGAARARFGVAIIEPISEVLIEGFQSLTKVVDNFGGRVRGAFEDLAESGAADAVRTFFEELPGLVDPAVEALAGLGPALAPLAITFGALGLGAISNVLGPLGALIPGVTSLAGAATVAATAFAVLTPEIRDELLPALVDIGEVGAEFGGVFVRGLSDALEDVSPVAVRAIGVIRDQVPAIQTFLGAAMAGLADVGEAALPILDKLVTFAEIALPVAFRIATDGITLLAEGAAAAGPIVEQLIDTAIGLVPVVSALVDGVEIVGSVLVPAIATLGEVIGAIPVGVLQTLLGVFLGFKAVGFIEGTLTGIGRSMGSLRRDINLTTATFQRFRAEGQSTFQSIRSSLGQLTSAGSLAQGFGTAVAGAFSGMALASEDSATRITGAVGSITSVLTGLATGGLAGGVFAAIGVGVGLIADGFIDAQREAEEFERTVHSVADAIRSEFNGQLVDFSGVINSKVFTQQVIDALDPTTFDQLVNELDIRMEDLVEVAKVGAQDVQTAIAEGITPEEAAQRRFDAFLGNISFKLAQFRAEQEDFPLNEVLAIDDIPLLDRTVEQQNLVAQSGAEAAEIIQQAKEDVFGLNDVLVATTEGWRDYTNQVTFAGDATSGVADAAEDSGNAQADAVQVAKDAILDTVLSADELRAMYLETGDAAETAADQAATAFEEFGDVLDSIRGKLDLTVAAQNLNADLRGIGESLSEIVNLDDLNQVDRINEDIARSRDRIADLQGRLAEENARASEEAGLLEQRIAKAEAIGAVNAAAELRRQLGEVFDDANDIQGDIDDEFAKIDEFKQELQGLTTEPITRMQQLAGQAAQANMSLFQFLLAGPTPEAREFFQTEIAGTVEAGLRNAEAIAETEGPIAGARAAEEFLGSFRTSLTDAGIDPTTVDQIIAEVLPADRVDELSQEAAEAAITAFLAKIDEVKNDPDATSLEIKVATLDLEEQATEIETFLTEHPDITLAANIDTTDFDSALETLRQRASQIDVEAERQRFGERNPEALNEFIKATQTDAEKAAEESGKRILDEINSLDPDTMEIPVRVEGIESELETLQNFLTETGVDLPVTLSIEGLTNKLTAAQINAEVQQRIQDQIQESVNAVLPSFLAFAEGGITGYREDHRAQIAHGYRVWAEPETGGEAYLPLGMNKRVSALGVFMKVAEIFDLDVRPRSEQQPQIIVPAIAPPPFSAPDQNITPVVHIDSMVFSPVLQIPDAAEPIVHVPAVGGSDRYDSDRERLEREILERQQLILDRQAIIDRLVERDRMVDHTALLDRQISDRRVLSQLVRDRERLATERTSNRLSSVDRLVDRHVVADHDWMTSSEREMLRTVVDRSRVERELRFDRLDREMVRFGSEPLGVFDRDVSVPEGVARMFTTIERTTTTNDVDVIRRAVMEAMMASRRPVTQEDYERNVIVERIEKLVIGEGESARKRASEFVREMRLRAARV